MGVRRWQWMPFRPPLLPADEPTSFKHRGQYKYIDFYINLLNLTKPFDSGLEKWMCKAARYLDGVDSSNPRCWRGKWLHHHGGGVCWLSVLLWMDSWCHKLIVCKKWYKNKLKMRLTVLLFDPPRRAPHLDPTLDYPRMIPALDKWYCVSELLILNVIMTTSEVALCPLLPWYCVKLSWNICFRDF